MDFSKFRFKPTILILSIFVCASLFFVAFTHASTTTPSQEAENGNLSTCASSTVDASASATSAVKFSGCSSGLDASGATIPDTNYPIPAGAVFMATTGSDSNPGTESQPVATLSKAISLAPNGGTVVIRGGTYRQGSSSSVYKKVTVQPYPHEQVWFDGTDVVTNWTDNGDGTWSVAWDTPDFCNGDYYDYGFTSQTATGPCAYYDEYGDPSNPLAADPQMVFKDGAYIHEVGSLAEATGDNFYYDQSAKKLYIGFDPSGHTVELTARANALVMQGGAGGNVVRGIGFQKYASNEFTGNVTEAAVLINSPNITMENDVFRLNAGNALGIADPRGVVVDSTVFTSNGSNGIVANGHENSTGETDGVVLKNSIFNGNNTELFGNGCSYSCMAAGVKYAHMDGFTTKNNLFENGQGVAHGFWCDEACTNGIMVGNVARNNGGHGIFYEVSDTGIIASNLIYGNGGRGIKMGSADTYIYNNTLVDNNVGVLIYDDQRYYIDDSHKYTQGTQIGPNTTHTNFANNIFVNNTGVDVESWRTSTDGNNTGPNTFYDLYDYNSYYRDGASVPIAQWKDGTAANYSSLSGFAAAHSPWGANGRDVTNGSNPFVSLANGNYTVKASNPDYSNGISLPSTVASAMGLTTSTPVGRGAITWWPNF